jgi:hypothetical protein
MQQVFDYNDDYSTQYRSLFSHALVESRNLGFSREVRVSEKSTIGNDVLKRISVLLGRFSGHPDTICPRYWGNSWQTLSTNIFAYLNAEGIPADIVIGNVIINGTDEFDTTPELIRVEVSSDRPVSGPQSIHAWVSVGDDTIVDAALPPRLAQYYGRQRILTT